jgi:hypothetical protein
MLSVPACSRTGEEVKSLIKSFVVFCLAVCTASAQTPVTSTTTTLDVTVNGSAVTTTAQNTVVTLMATVTAAGAPVVPGQVNFCDATAKLCTDIHLIGAAQLTAAGTASIKIVPGPGTHSYKAVFPGTTGDAGSGSATSLLTVTTAQPDASTTAITLSGSPGNYTLTALVTGKGALAPSGMVSFLDTSNANYLLATAPLSPQASSAGPLGFLNSSTPATNPYPQSIVVADFNGDGKLDLAVPIGGPSGLGVFLGNGDGTFLAAPGISVSGINAAGYAAVADFNGDGKPDIAITLPNNKSVLVLLGNGDGTFTPQPQIPVPYVFAIAAADLNGDGIPDLVTANFGGKSLTVFLGKGDGTFSPGATLATTGGPTWVAVGDFNGDGVPDLAAILNPGASALGSVEIFLGQGNGTFTPVASEPAVGYSPTTIVTGDLNGDGILDLAVANLTSNSSQPATVTVLLGKGDGTFTPTTQTLLTGNLPFSVAIGDFNGDGIPDLVTANEGGNTATVFLGNGDGTFTAGPSPTLGTNPVFAAVGDFNGDGLSDIAGVLNYPNFVAPILLAQETETQSATAVVSGISVVGTGTHLVETSYAGDGNYQPSNSGTIELTAGLIPTTLTLIASPTSTNSGQTVLLTATLSSSQAQNHTATGSVTFALDSTVLGTGTLSGGVATLSLQSLPTGVDNVTATYSGDTNFATASSAAIQITVSAGAPTATVTTLSVSPNPAFFGQPITFTAMVISAAGTPTGAVSFYDGTTLLGTATLAAGSATYSTSSLLVGVHTITASYDGSASFAESVSGAAIEAIGPAVSRKHHPRHRSRRPCDATHDRGPDDRNRSRCHSREESHEWPKGH